MVRLNLVRIAWYYEPTGILLVRRPNRVTACLFMPLLLLYIITLDIYEIMDIFHDLTALSIFSHAISYVNVDLSQS